MKHTSRPHALLLISAFCCFGGSLCANSLWSRKPADSWDKAYPIGNGRLGAMIYGGTTTARFQLNEDTLWSAGPHDYSNPEAHQHLSKVRALLSEGKYSAAEALAEKMVGSPKYQAAYQPLGELQLTFPDQEKATSYKRTLDLASATHTTTYTIGETTFTRTTFASHPDDVIIIHLSADKPKQLNFDLTFTSPHPFKVKSINDDTFALSGQIAPRPNPLGKGARSLIRTYDKPGLKFTAQSKVILDGGKLLPGKDKLTIQGANSAALIYTAATSFIDYQNVSGDPAAKVTDILSKVAKKNLHDLKKDHLTDYQGLYNRVRFTLSNNKSDQSTAELLALRSQGEISPELIETVFQFGRYLTIAGSRPGSQPLNLQGIWNQDMNPPWSSKYTLNINAEMNYWPAEVCNLSECHEPFLRMIKELQKPGAHTAKVHYQAGGWMIHHNTDLWRGTAPVDGAHWGMWPTGGAWLCQHLWQHYLFTQDKKFLAESYPIMKGAAEFFLDVLIEDAKGNLITSPSLSPEHSHGGETKNGLSDNRSGVSLCQGPTMDLQLINDLFTCCAEASSILKIDDAFRAKITATQKRLAPMQIGRFGQLQEWQNDWDNPDKPHSHVSHLYGLFPSRQINPVDTPKLVKAAQTSLTQRGFSGGWSGAWRITLWARLLNGKNAHTALTQHVMPRFGENLFSKGSYFQIDANFGATAGIAEMLLQSHNGELHLLPALPAEWPTGSIAGLRARGGFEVDLAWKDGQLTEATIHSLHGSPLKLRYQDQTQTVPLESGKKYLWKIK